MNHPYQNSDSPDYQVVRSVTVRTQITDLGIHQGFAIAGQPFWDVFHHPRRSTITVVYANDNNRILSIHTNRQDYGTDDWPTNTQIAINALTNQLDSKTGRIK